MRSYALSFLLLGALACGDDDSGGPNDAALAHDAATDAATDGGGDATLPTDSAIEDSGGDGAQNPDADSDSGVCVTEPFALFDFAPSRVPLSVLCGERCGTLEERNDELECFAIDEDAGLDAFVNDDDAGSGSFNWWTRSTGCGSVQIASVRPSWPRIYNYDPDTGELIGAAQLDDVGTELGDYPCFDAAYIAGEVRASCEGEQLEMCSWKPTARSSR